MLSMHVWTKNILVKTQRSIFYHELDLNDVSIISTVEETTFFNENSTLTTITTGVNSGKPIFAFLSKYGEGEYNKYRFNHFQNLNVNIQLFADPCSEVNCGKHASCRFEGTKAFCVCDEGWTYNPRQISAGCLGKFLGLSFKCLNQ